MIPRHLIREEVDFYFTFLLFRVELPEYNFKSKFLFQVNLWIFAERPADDGNSPLDDVPINVVVIRDIAEATDGVDILVIVEPRQVDSLVVLGLQWSTEYIFV